VRNTRKIRYLKFLRTLILAIVLILNHNSVHAQTFSSDTTSGENETAKENILESLASYSDDISGVFEKINLNSASPEELLSIPGMTTIFASSIITYRNKVKLIRDIDELSTLGGATPELILSLKTRTETSPAGFQLSGLQSRHNDNLSLNLLSYASYSPQKVSLYRTSYHDEGIRNFQKFSLDYHNAELDAISDKDPGQNNYLNFYSLSLSIRDISIFSTINLGDYNISLGNGMLFSAPGNISKSAGPISPLFSRRAYSLRPDRSLSKSGFLRGAAFAIPINDFEFTGFASENNLNVHIDPFGEVTSVDYSGSDLSTGYASLVEKIGGGILRFDSPGVDCGASAVYFSYDRPFANYYLQHRFLEDIFMRTQSEGGAFSGEMLIDKVVSVSANADLDYKVAQFAVGVRNLRSQKIPNYSGVLSESFPTLPEQGIYFGATFHPEKIAELGFYYDRFIIASISGGPDRNGEEIFIDSRVSMNHVEDPVYGEKLFDGTATDIYLRYRYKTKEDFYVPESEFPTAQSTLAGYKQNFRVDLRHNFSSAFSIRARFEKNFLSSGETGELFLLDAASTIKSFSINSRICFYSTGSYNSAFYEVEEDLPGIGKYSLLYGDGARIMALLNLKIMHSLSVGTEVSRDIYSRVRQVTVGSALESFPGITYFSLELNYCMD